MIGYKENIALRGIDNILLFGGLHIYDEYTFIGL